MKRIKITAELTIYEKEGNEQMEVHYTMDDGDVVKKAYRKEDNVGCLRAKDAVINDIIMNLAKDLIEERKTSIEAKGERGKLAEKIIQTRMKKPETLKEKRDRVRRTGLMPTTINGKNDSKPWLERQGFRVIEKYDDEFYRTVAPEKMVVIDDPGRGESWLQVITEWSRIAGIHIGGKGENYITI